jgi:hypothetical protein
LVVKDEDYWTGIKRLSGESPPNFAVCGTLKIIRLA